MVRRDGFIFKRNLVILVASFLLTGNLYSQERIVNGIIRTLKEIPVENVLISVKSSGEKFHSDSLGGFSAKCLDNDILYLSAEGFVNQKIRIKKNTKYAVVNLKLKPDEDAIEMAAGYGHVRDKNNLYAIVNRDQSQMNFSGYRNIYEALEANFPGLQIINGDIIIRGTSTSSASSPAALLIIDGREVNKDVFENISTSDIANINVLKDAATAVYGVRGGNGVVIVETKRGK
jgi:TonB-dependent SusC/RagA subfamily outer membrane receptor